MTTYYKLARPDGWDFHTGNTINYREAIGGVVKVPLNGHKKRELCTNSVLHASRNPLDCFVGAKIPCSAYRVEGRPVVSDARKAGFASLRVVEEITDLDALFGFNYTEATNPVHPFKVRPHKVTARDIESVKMWDSVWGSVWGSVGASVRDSVGDSVWASVRDSVRASVWDSVGASAWAYIGSLFPGITEWKYTPPSEGYPFQPAVDLWRRGFVPSFNGKVWRLHGAPDGRIVWEGTVAA